VGRPACLLGSVYTACLWRRAAAPRDRVLALAGLLFGTAACGHHATAALALPALVALGSTHCSR
jgi:hypothetical protein